MADLSGSRTGWPSSRSEPRDRCTEGATAVRQGRLRRGWNKVSLSSGAVYPGDQAHLGRARCWRGLLLSARRRSGGPCRPRRSALAACISSLRFRTACRPANPGSIRNRAGLRGGTDFEVPLLGRGWRGDTNARPAARSASRARRGFAVRVDRMQRRRRRPRQDEPKRRHVRGTLLALRCGRQAKYDRVMARLLLEFVRNVSFISVIEG